MSIIKRCAGLIAAMAVFAAASPVFAQASLKEEKVLIVVSSLDKNTRSRWRLLVSRTHSSGRGF
nr:hypothetical protein KXZ65_15960 [Pectobacterium sp. PL152]